jgi:hypothetical protein
MCPTAYEQMSFFGLFLKNKVSMLPEQPPMFFFQEAHNLDSKTHTRPTYNVSSEGCSQRHQGQGVRKVHPMRMSSCTLCARKGSRPRNIGEDAELCLPIWHCGTRKAFLMHVSTAFNAIKKWGTFKAYKEAIEAYVEQRKAVKQAKAALALLTAPAGKGKKASKKASAKKSPEKAWQNAKEGTALADAPDAELCKDYTSNRRSESLSLNLN